MLLLQTVYKNPEAVDDALVDLIHTPSGEHCKAPTSSSSALCRSCLGGSSSTARKKFVTDVYAMALARASGHACAADAHVLLVQIVAFTLPSAAGAEGALEAFVSVISGPPGPRPEAIFDNVRGPLLLLWGEDDTVTPLDGPVARFMAAAAKQRPDTDFVVLPGVRAFFVHLGFGYGAWLQGLKDHAMQQRPLE